jgi:hypothetical protein
MVIHIMNFDPGTSYLNMGNTFVSTILITMSLFINGKMVGEGRADHTVPWRFTFYSGMDISRNNGLPVDMSYADKSPFEFTGTVKKVVFDINHHRDEFEEKLHEFAHQGHVNRGIDA